MHTSRSRLPFQRFWPIAIVGIVALTAALVSCTRAPIQLVASTRPFELGSATIAAKRASGASCAYYLFGLLPIGSPPPSLPDAVDDAVRSAGQPILAEVTIETASEWYLLVTRSCVLVTGYPVSPRPTTQASAPSLSVPSARTIQSSVVNVGGGGKSPPALDAPLGLDGVSSRAPLEPDARTSPKETASITMTHRALTSQCETECGRFAAFATMGRDLKFAKCMTRCDRPDSIRFRQCISMVAHENEMHRCHE